mmetsp:Transcript_4191/g.9521  ORF Transcript_4191/g.9521 Transcript_4191/m.9521 type:complete len:202 (+) Transcript_4191:354-959(+)
MPPFRLASTSSPRTRRRVSFAFTEHPASRRSFTQTPRAGGASPTSLARSRASTRPSRTALVMECRTRRRRRWPLRSTACGRRETARTRRRGLEGSALTTQTARACRERRRTRGGAWRPSAPTARQSATRGGCRLQAPPWISSLSQPQSFSLSKSWRSRHSRAQQRHKKARAGGSLGVPPAPTQWTASHRRRRRLTSSPTMQ